jgi:protein-S-isoprenylcysteine O-methyltransferase Ste14
MTDESEFRAFVFKNRGALLAAPAALLVALGKPSKRSIAFGLPIAVAGELLRCWAVGYSGTTTREDHVTAPRLVTAGPYAHTRNPLYVGNLITALGFSIAFTGGMRSRNRALLTALGIGTMLGVYATIVPHEEAYLADTFGDDYADYRLRVPRLGWRIKPAPFAQGEYDGSTIVEAETRTFMTFAAMTIALLFKGRRS